MVGRGGWRVAQRHGVAAFSVPEKIEAGMLGRSLASDCCTVPTFRFPAGITLLFSVTVPNNADLLM